MHLIFHTGETKTKPDYVNFTLRFVCSGSADPFACDADISSSKLHSSYQENYVRTLAPRSRTIRGLIENSFISVLCLYPQSVTFMSYSHRAEVQFSKLDGFGNHNAVFLLRTSCMSLVESMCPIATKAYYMGRWEPGTMNLNLGTAKNHTRPHQVKYGNEPDENELPSVTKATGGFGIGTSDLLVADACST